VGHRCLAEIFGSVSLILANRERRSGLAATGVDGLRRNGVSRFATTAGLLALLIVAAAGGTDPKVPTPVHAASPKTIH
jgi:hypothetical protein